MNKIKNIKRHIYDGVLFLRGAFVENCKCPEDVLQDKLISEHFNYQSNVEYNKIPPVFTSGIFVCLKIIRKLPK